MILQGRESAPEYSDSRKYVATQLEGRVFLTSKPEWVGNFMATKVGGI